MPMKFYGQDQGKLRFRLLVLGMPKCYISPFLGEINKWVSHNGIEWTISRLKSLKVDLFRRRSGLSNLTWIRKNRRGDISGPIGGLFRWSDRSDKNFRSAIQFFMIYTNWYLPEVSEKQMDKFISGVCATPTPIASKTIRSISKEAVKFSSLSIIPDPDPLLSYEGSSEKRSPVLFRKQSLNQSDKVMDEIHYFNTNEGMYLYTKYQKIFEPILKGFEQRKLFLNQLNKGSYSSVPFVGKIAFIQEPGGKLRSVASPYRLFQMALKPFGDRLYQIAKKLPWDCTHNQSAAFEPIRLALEKGKKVYSVDLSSATDFFPLEIQFACIRSLIGASNLHYLNLWAELCRGKWFLPDRSQISWSKGQPLGMYPSFAAFTISHGLLIQSLLKKKWNGEFFVLGDDVVILDDSLATKYFDTLTELGCPYSTEKTLQSEKIAEFAGKVIIPSGVYPQMKWRELSDDNFLDICRMLGPRSRVLLRQRQRKVFDKVKNLCEPIGLNFSLPGDNLAKMVERTMSSPLFSPEKSILNSLMGLRRRINLNLYSVELQETTSKTEISDIISTFDEKVRFVLRTTLFSRAENLSAIAEGLASLPEALGLEPRLPLLAMLPSRVTQLERYEAALRTDS